MRVRYLLSTALVSVMMSSCGGDRAAAPVVPGIAIPDGVTSVSAGYTLSVFAKIPGTLRPDDLVIHGNHLYVVAQDNNDNPDGTQVAGTHPQSQLIEYDLTGKLLMTFNIPGHPDGLMEFDAETLWVSTNEDASPLLIVINTTTDIQVTLSPDAIPVHGGGLDDMKLLNGVVYTAASNPTLAAPTATAPNGTSTVPAMYVLSLNADNQTFHLAPALMGNASATSLITQMPTTLNMTDPDSMAVDTNGDLVIDSQQDSELVFVHNPGASQTVSVLPLTLYGNSWPVDDTKWAPVNSYMLLADNAAQLIYRIDATSGYAPGSAYSAGVGTLLALDSVTGFLTPLVVGMGNPHGMTFVMQ